MSRELPGPSALDRLACELPSTGGYENRLLVTWRGDFGSAARWDVKARLPETTFIGSGESPREAAEACWREVERWRDRG